MGVGGSMRQFSSPDGNMLGHIVGRSLNHSQVPYPVLQSSYMRAMQMHSSLVQRLDLEKVMEGHHGCVNTIAWNASGSLLISGSDDTKVNIWSYGSRKLIHSIETGHSANIFCTKFMPETGDDIIVSGAGDAEVRVHRVSRSSGSPRGSYLEQTALFRCHTRRVKKLAVEDGNPHVVWSASEDGTLRQHDFREGVLCPPSGPGNQECRNILLDLRSGHKRSLSDTPRHCLHLKTCAINPTRPHLLLIGGSDAFARLYDRRMLPPPTSTRQLSRPPPCVSYFCPAHLSDHSRSGLHLTHVTFSPNGQEVLLSYSGEHVYLMDANSGRENPVVYVSSDVPKRTSLTTADSTANSVQASNVGKLGHGYRRNSAWLHECKELAEEAKKAFEEGNNYTRVIEATGEVLDAGGQVVGDSLRHDCLCIRAAAFLKRQWKNDVHMAIRDLNDARHILATSSRAYHYMAEALSQLGRYKEALEFAIRSYQLDPSDTRLLDHVAQLRAKINAEEARMNRGSDADQKLERKVSRIRSISDFLRRTESNASDGLYDAHSIDREESDFFDDDMEEMEMEVEPGAPEEEVRFYEAGVSPISSLNLRLQHRGETVGKETPQMKSSPPLTDNCALQIEVAVDMQQRYVGHCNTGTDIKQASFLGEKGEFVASGSDDGRWFIWSKKTGRLIKMLNGDENVVNCVQSHPFDCAIATSGIDNTIKLWTPCARVPSIVAGGESGPDTADSLQVMADNQNQMRRHREIGLPMEFLQRFRVQEGAEGVGHPFQCTQS
ncbi:hypothetical protein KC19_7G125100 [Ceratodon purpureus]|uniref:WD and tetratricopeptide repeats protein 1 n=1 Tax=Ceratodon purpureus TaxID=3225 RepID=A0A8T0H7E0_CERPU|nr:hypothetical protein KC19_7G125100 [Ceratodon purpureus]